MSNPLTEETIKILNIDNVQTAGKEQLLAFCNERIESGEGAALVPMNPIKVVKARSRPEFQKMINEADWVFADASGIRIAAKMLHDKVIETCPGWQMMIALLEQCAENDRSVYFLGTTDEILELGKEKFLEKHPNLKIAGMHNGFYTEAEEDALYQQIADSRPDYVFIAMGEYKQEIVLEKIRKKHSGAIYQGVGGSIDLVAGRQPMPPAWVQRFQIEWVYRAIRQPFRLPRFKALPIFAALVLMAKFKLRKNA